MRVTPGELRSLRRAVIGFRLLNGEGEAVTDLSEQLDGSVGIGVRKCVAREPG